MVRQSNRRQFGKWMLRNGILVPFIAPKLIHSATIFSGPIMRTINAAGGGSPVNPVTFESVSNVNGSQAVTYTHTIGNLTNGYITIGISTYTARDVTNVVFDSLGSAHAATKLVEHVNAGDSELHSEIWGVPIGNKGAGTYTVAVTVGTSGALEFASASMAFQNVHQTVSTGTANQADAVSNAPSVVITSAALDMVIDNLARWLPTTVATQGAGQTKRWEFSDGGSVTDGAGSTEAGAASVTMSWSLTASANWTLVGVPLKPAT